MPPYCRKLKFLMQPLQHIIRILHGEILVGKQPQTMHHDLSARTAGTDCAHSVKYTRW